jgi:para-aminobenzoate synthetase component 1
MAARLAGRRGRALLHSGSDDDGCGRWSFVACEPRRTLEARGRQLIARDRAGAVVHRDEGDPLDALERLVAAEVGARERMCTNLGHEPIPVAIGYLGYDVGRAIEPLGAGPPPGPSVPDVWIGVYDAIWRYDHARDTAEIIAADARAAARLEAALTRPDAIGPAPGLEPLRDAEPALDTADDGNGDPDGDGVPRAYRQRIERIAAYIAAGDVYQVNLARRLIAPMRAPGDALALYAALDRRSPAPFGALLDIDGGAIISGSPERFLARAPGSHRLETRPIKGTRRRTGDAACDRAAAAALAVDAKERAEHLMIVDLERNDLGRLAEIGGVRVDALGYVVELPTLYHLVSRISCALRPGVGLAEILRATFPGGSITGAPKIRAMQIIDELEPVRRGPYTGAIGYMGVDDALDLSIAIRGAACDGDALHLYVGGGVVADSTSAREFEETEEKAAAWRAALAEVFIII